jgi:hypothetical protein
LTIDQETFDRITIGEPSVELDEARRYLEDIPEMGPRITSKRDGTRISYKIEWTDDVENTLHPLMHSSSFWRKRFEVQLPRRLDQRLYRRYKQFLGRNGDYVLARISELAEKSAPSQEAIDDILRWMKSPENGHQALTALEYFCKNGLEVGQLDDETQTKIVNSLLDAFFYKMSKDQVYEPALEIIRMLNVKDGDVATKSKELILSSLKSGLDDMRYRKLGQSLARDPRLREALIRGAEDVMFDSDDDRVKKLCKSFIKSI